MTPLSFFISERSVVELTGNGYARTVLQNGRVLGMVMPMLGTAMTKLGTEEE